MSTARQWRGAPRPILSWLTLEQNFLYRLNDWQILSLREQVLPGFEGRRHPHVGCLESPNVCTCQGALSAPSAAPLRPAPRQGHATIALLALVPLGGTAVRELPLLLLTEGQYKKGGKTKPVPPAGCCPSLFFPPFPPPATPRAKQGLTKSWGWKASGWRLAFPVLCLCPPIRLLLTGGQCNPQLQQLLLQALGTSAGDRGG